MQNREKKGRKRGDLVESSEKHTAIENGKYAFY